jgi:hypothetical protein
MQQQQQQRGCTTLTAHLPMLCSYYLAIPVSLVPASVLHTLSKGGTSGRSTMARDALQTAAAALHTLSTVTPWLTYVVRPKRHTSYSLALSVTKPGTCATRLAQRRRSMYTTHAMQARICVLLPMRLPHTRASTISH